MRMCFTPHHEELEDIIHHTKPEGKKVLSVSAYGYPFAFLAAGASHVKAFDVSKYSVAWNMALRAAVTALNYNENRALMCQELDNIEPVLKRIAEHVPTDYRELVLDMVRSYYGADVEEVEACRLSKYDKQKITNYYPHIANKDNFDKVKKAVLAGGLEIEEGELISMLERSKDVDVVYASSIRDWVRSYNYRSNDDGFIEEYEKNLAKTLKNVLSNGGIFYDFFIRTNFAGSFVPPKEIPMQESIYDFLTITRYKNDELADGDELTVITIATKK